MYASRLAIVTVAVLGLAIPEGLASPGCTISRALNNICRTDTSSLASSESTFCIRPDDALSAAHQYERDAPDRDHLRENTSHTHRPRLSTDGLHDRPERECGSTAIEMEHVKMQIKRHPIVWNDTSSEPLIRRNLRNLEEHGSVVASVSVGEEDAPSIETPEEIRVLPVALSTAALDYMGITKTWCSTLVGNEIAGMTIGLATVMLAFVWWL